LHRDGGRVKEISALGPPPAAGRVEACAGWDRRNGSSCRLDPPGWPLPPGRVVLGLADFVCPVQPGAADGVAFDGGDHVIEGEAGWQAGGLVEGEELEDVGVGPV